MTPDSLHTYVIVILDCPPDHSPRRVVHCPQRRIVEFACELIRSDGWANDSTVSYEVYQAPDMHRNMQPDGRIQDCPYKNDATDYTLTDGLHKLVHSGECTVKSR